MGKGKGIVAAGVVTLLVAAAFAVWLVLVPSSKFPGHMKNVESAGGVQGLSRTLATQMLQPRAFDDVDTPYT